MARISRGDDGVCPTMTNVLVVDEASVLESVSVALEREGFAVLVATTADAALAQAYAWRPAVVLVAARLSDGSGLDVLAEMRRRDRDVCVLIAGHGSADEQERALALGADDYLVRPLAPREVAARVVSIVHGRRVPAPVVDLEALEIDQTGLSAPELDLLVHLAAHPRQTFTAEQLGGEELVRSLRDRIEADPSRPRWLVTIPRVGYRFEPGFADQTSRLSDSAR